MAVLGQKQKKPPHCFRKNLFQTARRHGAVKILRLFTFQGESRVLKKTSFHRDKNKARQASCFDRQEQCRF